MATSGEITLEHNGKRYGATYSVHHKMLEVKTHTEVRSVELGSEDPEKLAQRTLQEIVTAKRP